MPKYRILIVAPRNVPQFLSHPETGLIDMTLTLAHETLERWKRNNPKASAKLIPIQ